MSRERVRSILVAGDDIIGRSAALAFSRALPQVAVTLLDQPGDTANRTDQFSATLPLVNRFHAALGLDELDLVRRGIASHNLGTRFTGSGDWVRSFGDVGRDEGTVPFRQMWLAARRAGRAQAFDHYSPASVIGRRGKFVHPSGSPSSPLAGHVYGLRFNSAIYRDFLGQATRHLKRVAGPIMEVERREDGGIAALHLSEERRVEADLFVDCTGPHGLLISPDAIFVDWSDWLPARHVASEWHSSEALQPLDHVASTPDGWALTATAPGAVLKASVTTGPTPRSVDLRPGRRARSFVANVLALGDGAVSLDPLHGANLSLAHAAILRAIDLFPSRDCDPLELAEYNRLTALECDRARDYHALFQIPHASAAPPASLGRTLTQWRSRGRLPFFEEEPFTASDWEQALIGLGLIPDHVAPAATIIDPDVAGRAMADYARELAAIAARLPSYPDYLARMANPPPRAG